MKIQYISNTCTLTMILLWVSSVSLKTMVNDQKRPNIVFIFADDLGWGDVSLHGSHQVRTPNIDVLASNGIILNNYYVQPLCSPSRSALLTGYHPIRTGLQHGVIYNNQPWGLPLKFKLLPEYLKGLGYDTHLIGKWHQGFFKKEYLPTNRGFDTHFGYYSGHIDYYDMISGGKTLGFDFRDNEEKVEIEKYKGLYVTDVLTNRSIDVIVNNTKHSENPFFIFLSHSAVHAGRPQHPLQAPQHVINRFKHIKDRKRRTFAAMISALDDSVGEVISILHNTKILNETIVIFSTDNGGAIRGIRGRSIDKSVGSNWPLRGSKYTLFEGGIRGFAFIWSPLLKKRYTSEHLMHIQDWLPTIYSAIGGNVKDLGSIDGIDMWDVLKHNKTSPRNRLLHNIDDIWKVWALRDGDYKLISGSVLRGHFNQWYLPPGESRVKNSTINEVCYENSKVYKVLKELNFNVKPMNRVLLNCSSVPINNCKPESQPCLFDLRSDPCEHYNLYEIEPNIVNSMLDQLSKYNSSAVKPCNRPKDEKSNPKYHNNFWSVWQ